MIRRTNVAEHSFGTAALSIEIMDDLSWNYIGNYESKYQILKKALLHDLHESVLSDIPYDVKRIDNSLFKSLLLEEDKLDRSANIPKLSPEHDLIVQTADMLELAFTLVEDIELGNKTYQIFEIVVSSLVLSWSMGRKLVSKFATSTANKLAKMVTKAVSYQTTKEDCFGDDDLKFLLDVYIPTRISLKGCDCTEAIRRDGDADNIESIDIPGLYLKYCHPSYLVDVEEIKRIPGVVWIAAMYATLSGTDDTARLWFIQKLDGSFSIACIDEEDKSVLDLLKLHPNYIEL